MDRTDEEWAQWGKELLFLWGLTCLAVCFYSGPGEFQVLVKLWLGLLGLLSLFTSSRNLV